MQEVMGDDQLQYEQIKNVDLDRDGHLIDMSLKKLNEDAD